jgi:pilus assembly protein Flp/PilA
MAEHNAPPLGRDAFANLIGTRYGVSHMKKFIVAFVKDQEGLTMVEYAIAGALVTAAAVAAFTNLGSAVVTSITTLVTAVNT